MGRDRSYQYIVVGAGTAGCVVASRLSATGASVLLLERGGPDTDPSIADPAKVIQGILGAPRYETTPQRGLSYRPVAVQRGVMLGGCSSVHGMVYVRGNRRDYDLWAQLGNDGWSFDEVLPYFRRSENYSEGPSHFHGVGGPLDVRWQPRPSTAALAFLDAASQAGFPWSGRHWDFNGAQQENAAGLYQVNVTADGKRASSAVAFLGRVADREHLHVRTDARVTRILLDAQERAIGVECVGAGDTLAEYRAEREVIVAAGTFESPKLLMLSGIGPADHLRQVGIRTRIHLPGVGENLHDHLQILIYHYASQPVGQAEFTAEAGLFVNTRDRSSAVSPDLQYHVLAGMAHLMIDPRTPNFLICPVLCRPQSRGTVRLAGANPLADPLIDPRFLQCEADVRVLSYGIELATHLTASGALGKLFRTGQRLAVPARPRQEGERLPVPDRGQRESFVRRTVNTVWHPVGTCKMGRDAMAVVDPQLRVYGVERLRVADASIMPSIPSGNTNAACFMIGEKCADLIRHS